MRDRQERDRQTESPYVAPFVISDHRDTPAAARRPVSLGCTRVDTPFNPPGSTVHLDSQNVQMRLAGSRALAPASLLAGGVVQPLPSSCRPDPVRGLSPCATLLSTFACLSVVPGNCGVTLSRPASQASPLIFSLPHGDPSDGQEPSFPSFVV